jgi:hypothetical protein
MDWQIAIQLLERFGFPVACAVGALWISATVLLRTHDFVIGELTNLVKRTTAALTAVAETNREQAAAAAALAERIEHCPGNEFRVPAAAVHEANR